MMEIVHDMAPGAKLFFATAYTSPESFADNIRTLRFVYHCDIIVDDVIYYFESPYQDDIVARAVIDVTNDGGRTFLQPGTRAISTTEPRGFGKVISKKRKARWVPCHPIMNFMISEEGLWGTA